MSDPLVEISASSSGGQSSSHLSPPLIKDKDTASEGYVIIIHMIFSCRPEHCVMPQLPRLLGRFIHPKNVYKEDVAISRCFSIGIAFLSQLPYKLYDAILHSDSHSRVRHGRHHFCLQPYRPVLPLLGARYLLELILFHVNRGLIPLLQVMKAARRTQESMAETRLYTSVARPTLLCISQAALARPAAKLRLAARSALEGKTLLSVLCFANDAWTN